MVSRLRLLRKRVEETADRDPLVAWALALWLSTFPEPSFASYREVADAQLKAAREQGKMDSKWPQRAKYQTDPVIAYALLSAATQWMPPGLSLTWREREELNGLRERLNSAAEERIVEFETHAALQDFERLAQSNPEEALELAATLDIPFRHAYDPKLTPPQRTALQARVASLRIEEARLARRMEANQLELEFRQSVEARLPEKARSLAEKLFAPPPDFDVTVAASGRFGASVTLKASQLRYARVRLENVQGGGAKQGVVQSVLASPLRVVVKRWNLPAEEWNLSNPRTLLWVEELASLPDDILHSPPADFLSPETRASVEQAREELERVLANPSGQRFWLLDLDDPVPEASGERGPQEPEESSRFALLDFDAPPPPPPEPTPRPKPMPPPPRAEADRALREFREGLARDARTQVDLAGHTLVRHWRLLTHAEQGEVRAGLAQQTERRSNRFANLEVDEPKRIPALAVAAEDGPSRFGLLEVDDPAPVSPPPLPPCQARAEVTASATAAVLVARWHRLTAAVRAAAPVEEHYAVAWLVRHRRRLLGALGGRGHEVDAAIQQLSAP